MKGESSDIETLSRQEISGKVICLKEYAITIPKVRAGDKFLLQNQSISHTK